MRKAGRDWGRFHRGARESRERSSQTPRIPRVSRSFRTPPADTPPVARGELFRGTALRVHDNVCRRTDPHVSEETRPLEFHEVVFPRSGVWVRHRGRRAIVIDPYRVHLFARGDVHRVSHPGRCGDRNTGLVLTDETLRELDPRAAERGFETLAAPIGERLYAEHCALVDGLHGGALDPLEAEERALRLAAAALASAREPRCPQPPRSDAQRRRHRDLAHAAQRLLATRYRERLGLGEVAAELDASVHHLCRVFRAELGTSLHAYRRSLRVRAALRLLPDPTLTLYDVAERAGFSDRTQLTRALCRSLGEAPTAYRGRLGREQGMPRPPRARA